MLDVRLFHCIELMENMNSSFNVLDCNTGIIAHYVHNQLDRFPRNKLGNGMIGLYNFILCSCLPTFEIKIIYAIYLWTGYEPTLSMEL